MRDIKPVKVPAPALIQRQTFNQPATRQVQAPPAVRVVGGKLAAMAMFPVVQMATQVVKAKEPKWKPPPPGLSAKEKKTLKNTAGHAKKVAVVVEAQKTERQKCLETVQFTQNFNTHVLHGEVNGTSHGGYHSQNVTNHAAFGACNVTHAADAHGVERASCTMTNQAVAKPSSFFPAGWDINRIRDESRHAYCNQIGKGGIGGAGALSWVGNSTVAGLLIGSTSGLPLNTAFPSHNGSF